MKSASAHLPDVQPGTPLTRIEVQGLDKRSLTALASIGVTTAGDLLGYFPRRYEDRRQFDRFPNQPGDQAVCLRAEVTDTSLRRIPGRRSFFEARIEPPGGDALGGVIVCRWFNMPYMHKIIAAGQDVVVYGKPKQSGKRLVIDHPDFEVIDEDAEEGASIHLDRITPIYRLTSGISQRNLRGAIFHLLEGITDEVIADLLPAEKAPGGLSRAQALRQVHFPRGFDDLNTARRYLALEEFLALQLRVLLRRRDYEAHGGAAHCGPGELLKQFAQRLPFGLTEAQKRSLKEIRADLRSSHPMNRLLQGDVGSGKTVVALSAMLLAVEAGFQAALMAPTQILAEQHYLNFQNWLEPLGIRVSLRTAARKEDGFLPLLSGGDEPQIIVGTHALLHGGVSFDRLGLVVIDEQHKFGVAQRAKLIEQGTVPDVLVMTATPIPRTLTLTVYGDLDVSIIDELPEGRGKIVTGVREATKLKEAAAFIQKHLNDGRQAYIVYPLIEESEKVKSLAAAVEFEKWEERFKGHRCGLLHGRLTGDEKESVMRDFREGRLHVLVTTTVIEVGVDVPNANLMIVFNAERFGLAQLHQLRGRVGRGAHKSYCILMCDPKNEGAREKLAVLEETTDGFRIAEADLELRGPGELLGTAQSGLPDLRMGDLITDTALVHEAREIANRVLEEDPELRQPASQALLNRFASTDQSAGRLS